VTNATLSFNRTEFPWAVWKWQEKSR